MASKKIKKKKKKSANKLGLILLAILAFAFEEDAAVVDTADVALLPRAREEDVPAAATRSACLCR